MFARGEGMDKNGAHDDSNLFQTVSKQRLVDRVVADIQALIIQGKLAVGAKLPPERELAELFGVSRTVIREAVRILVTKGLLESKHGIGTMVRQGTRDQLVEPLGWLLQRNDATLDDLHEVRTILEVEIAAEAAKRATAEDIAQLDQLIEHAATVRADPAAFAASDAEFHQLLAGILRNVMLSVLLDSIRTLMSEIRLQVSRNSEFGTTVLADHAVILEAIRSRDPVQARAAMQAHLVHARAFQRALEQEIRPQLLD
jgi:GntR family transcriptional regulator, transcriptional repressor for pyruvate dehydrogenase complex